MMEKLDVLRLRLERVANLLLPDDDEAAVGAIIALADELLADSDLEQDDEPEEEPEDDEAVSSGFVSEYPGPMLDEWLGVPLQW